MHELSVVFHIAQLVEDVAKKNNVSKVKKVILEVGEVSLIVHPYLQDCWKWKSSKSEILNGCTLEAITIKAITHCNDCGTNYSTTKYGKTCPHCGSENTYLIQGDETKIKEIVVEDNNSQNK